MKKSKPLAKTPNGNAAKYVSYREAWARINAARESGFHVEAITLLESIISDRLIAYLLSVDKLVPLSISKRHHYPFFRPLIDMWKSQHPEPIIVAGYSDLQAAVDTWREHRNRAIHEIVRVEENATIMCIDEYLRLTETASAEGVALGKAVTNWCRKAVRKRTVTRESVRRVADGTN